jgi:phosphopantothenoylcysteine decarboxylase/phosphopantothenate--cysteine ligase
VHAQTDGRLRGKHIIVTAGPTIEPIDPVRYLSNRSSGKQGYAVAAALARHGAAVTLVSGPTNLAAPAGVKRISVQTAREMLAACEHALPADAAVCVAAVADYRPASESELKLEKSKCLQLELVANPDILATLSTHAKRPTLVVGFAAQTHAVEAYAKQKLAKKGCDWIVANDVSGDVLGGDENQVSLIRADGITQFARMSKAAVAERLADEIAACIE